MIIFLIEFRPRLDGGGEPVCHEKDTGCGSYMAFNVAWNSENKEIYPKGDNHTLTNNVAFDDGDSCTICVPPEHGVGWQFNRVKKTPQNGR